MCVYVCVSDCGLGFCRVLLVCLELSVLVFLFSNVWIVVRLCVSVLSEWVMFVFGVCCGCCVVMLIVLCRLCSEVFGCGLGGSGVCRCSDVVCVW